MTAPIPPQPRSARRWPPIAAAGVGFLLVFLALPNPLKIPQNNPTAAAEYAPVPGKQQEAPNANFGETDLASSAGIGSGGFGEGVLPGAPPPAPPIQFKPRQHNCVGDPPRQTEDPLSPPCVPLWDGNNGGETWNGVSADQILVAFYNDAQIDKTDFNRPWRPSDEAPDHTTDFQRTFIVRTIKAQLKYFQSRYQTYGRTVHVIAQKSQTGLETTEPQRRADAASTKIEINPFAAVHLGDGAQDYMDELASVYRTPVFGLNSDVARSVFTQNRPFIWGFFPDQEAEAGWSASFLCRQLHGRDAVYAGDAELRGRRRTFGLLYPTDSQRGDESETLAKLLIRNAADECGLKFVVSKFFDSGQTEAPTAMQAFADQKITTVVCYCVPVPTEQTVGAMQGAATRLNYHPEWYWDHASRMFRAIWNQRYGDDTQPSLGVSHHWRNNAFEQQYHYQAYLSMEPGTKPNTRFNFDIYHLFLNLFEAIQAAGPNLTPETVERGMFTFAYTNRADPFVPTGGYGSRYHGRAVGDYTFVDTAMAWWWDPTGTPPGGQDREGCLRVALGGKRFFAHEWPRKQLDLFNRSGAPCSQDDTEISETGLGGF